MKLTGKQLKQLHDALLGAFSLADLQQMVTFELNENLDAIAGGGNLSQTVFNLIQWAERRGRMVDLVQGAVNQNENNAELLAVRDVLLGAPTAEPQTPTLQLKNVQPKHVRPAVSKPKTTNVLNSGKAWAVLVGVNQYEDESIADLRHAVSDISAVHAAIESEFEVVRVLTDDSDLVPTRAKVLAALNSVAQSADEGSLLLFHFSGHGIAEAGQSYLLPRDAQAAALRDTSISMARVHEIMEDSPARAKVIVLDACHSGASVGKSSPRMTPEFIERVFEQAEGMAVLASCKQNQQSWEWPDKEHGVFTHFLLEALSGDADFDEKGFVTVQDVGRYVTDQVRKWSAENDRPQTPTLEVRVAGDIVLLHYGEDAESSAEG